MNMMKDIFIRRTKEESKESTPIIAADMEKYLQKKIRPVSIRQILQKNNYHGRVAQSKPKIKKIKKVKRLEFARKYTSMDSSFWKNVPFANESKFYLNGSNEKITIWREPNIELKIKKNIIPAVKKGSGSVTVWGCMFA